MVPVHKTMEMLCLGIGHLNFKINTRTRTQYWSSRCFTQDTNHLWQTQQTKAQLPGGKLLRVSSLKQKFWCQSWHVSQFPWNCTYEWDLEIIETQFPGDSKSIHKWNYWGSNKYLKAGVRSDICCQFWYLSFSRKDPTYFSRIPDDESKAWKYRGDQSVFSCVTFAISDQDIFFLE